jgi:hypothetical protein
MDHSIRDRIPFRHRTQIKVLRQVSHFPLIDRHTAED